MAPVRVPATVALTALPQYQEQLHEAGGSEDAHELGHERQGGLSDGLLLQTIEAGQAGDHRHLNGYEHHGVRKGDGRIARGGGHRRGRTHDGLGLAFLATDDIEARLPVDPLGFHEGVLVGFGQHLV